jgi:antitoxin component YwqK of YwqJK toxin-antitoxin module
MKTLLASIFILASVLIVSCGGIKHKDYTMGKDGLFYKYGSHKLYAGTITDTVDVIVQFSVIWGKKNGEFITHYPNGQLEKFGFIRNNLNEGEWKYYYPNGILESKGVFNNSIANGRWIYFYSNGIIKAEGDFENNANEGKWIYYNEDGTIKNIEYFHDGNLLEVQAKERII